MLDIGCRTRRIGLLGNNLRPRAQLCRAGLSQLVASSLHVHKRLALGLRGDTLGNGARIHVAELRAVHNPLARRARRRHANRNRAVEATATLKMCFFDTPTPRQRHLRERLASRSIACGMELKVAGAGSIRRGCTARRRRRLGTPRWRICRHGRARRAAFARPIIDSRLIRGLRSIWADCNILKPHAAARAKLHRHAGDPRQLRPACRAESQVTHPVHPSFHWLFLMAASCRHSSSAPSRRYAVLSSTMFLPSSSTD